VRARGDLERSLLPVWGEQQVEVIGALPATSIPGLVVKLRPKQVGDELGCE